MNVAVFVFLALVFWLFNVRMSIIFFALIMWAFVLLVSGFLDYLSFSRKAKLLRTLEDENIPLTDFKPSNWIEKEYVRLLNREYDYKKNVTEKDQIRYEETVDYFTIWAHQIKTPISAISLVAENIQDDETRVDIKNAVTDISDYVDMVLNYMRLDSETNDLVFDKVDLDSVIKALLKKFSSQFIGRGINMAYGSKPVVIVTDEKWISFILGQILSNALKYSRKGTITIELFNDRVYIKDQGIGISAEDLPRVFEKGYTGYNGRTDNKSTGIGLYLVKRACDLINADIKIESVLGEGTDVTVFFEKGELDVRD